MTEDKLPRRTEKPWGYELLFALTDRYAGKLIFIKKGHRLSPQYHSQKDESMFICQGKVLMEVEYPGGPKQTITLEPGQCIHLPPFTRHRLEAIEDTTLFEVSTPELDDVTRLADDYGRTGE
jgi:mannose-6-phosphate isomerase-like protein (cupin superfamily)